MQTFLPYPDFAFSAKCLDSKRLGKQRVEAKQIYNSLTLGGGWRHHPAVTMWKGYHLALCEYGFRICVEWCRRGYEDTLGEWFLMKIDHQPFVLPWWVGDSRLHDSHKSNLLRKDPLFYGKYNWAVSDALPYYWPKTGSMA